MHRPSLLQIPDVEVDLPKFIVEAKFDFDIVNQVGVLEGFEEEESCVGELFDAGVMGMVMGTRFAGTAMTLPRPF